MTKLFINIKELLQVRDIGIKMVSGTEMKQLPSIKNAFLRTENDIIIGFGQMQELTEIVADEIIDCNGKIILPTWCDSHTHIVYAGNREQEFVDRINGLSYEEIANRGGGILNSALKLNQTSEEQLYEESKERLEEVIKLGTGAVEIKSGYGLSTESEIKMLRVIRRLAENYPINIKSTFLGAHAFPKTFQDNKEEYIRLIIDEMIPKIAEEKLADFIDVFCEKGYFDTKQTKEILEAGKRHGLQGKIHVNQFHSIGGVKLGVEQEVLSIDHLEIMNDEDIEILKESNVMPVALPSCSYFLSIPYTPARKIMEAGLPLALATDYNPGSTPSGNMNFVVSTACIKMKMTPEEAINAATINAAYAMGISDTHGSISIGKKANIIVTKKINSFYQIPYSFGSNLIEKVYLNGEEWC